MIISRSIKSIRGITARTKKKGKTVGFVPTMGSLHEGHISLVRAAREECGFVVVSIFINPIQFGPKEDFKNYPRNLKKDELLLKEEGVDLVFYPTTKSMYADNFSVYVEEDSLSRHLCGVSRPEHFRGVCTVVAKLFNIVGPDIAYFGQKDFQQAYIIKRMIRDLNFPLKIVITPIIREDDGLAMSSRNTYLEGRQRKDALCLYHSLILARKMVRSGIRPSKVIINQMRKLIREEAHAARIDYVSIVNSDTLDDVEMIEGKTLAAVAVYIGKTRLIDNMLLK